RLGARPLLATVRLIRRLGIEVVHTHGKGAGLHGRLAARWTGVAAVHTFHGIHYERYRRPLQALYLGLERRLGRWTHTVIHVSPTQEAEARRLGLAAPGRGATVINGVDLDEQDRSLAASPLTRADLGLRPGLAALGSVARFDPVKRLDALLEAMGAGLAVVATDVPGHRDVVAHGTTGLLVPPGDARALATAIGALLDDPERRARMGRAGRARVLSEFSIQPMVAKTAEIYRAAATASAR